MSNNNIIDKTNFTSQPTVPASQKYTAEEFNTIKNFQNEPVDKLTTFTDTNIIIDGIKSYSTIKTITAATHTITANATLSNHVEGNHYTVRYSFSQDCTLTLVNFDDIGNELGDAGIFPISSGTYNFKFQASSFGVNLLIKNNNVTPNFVLALSNFSIEDVNKDRVYFNTNQAPVGTTYAGFTFADPTKTIISVTFNTGNTIGHYFTVSAPYVAGDTSPTIAYDGTDDWTGSGGALVAFTATAITNNIGLIQLAAVTLGTVIESNGEVQIAVTNPNSSNEDQNQLYYKLNTEPTTWTTGAVMASGGTTVTQTGLTNDLIYNFNMIPEGDGVTYSNGPDSNVVNGTPAIPSVFDEITNLIGTTYYWDGGDASLTTLNGSLVEAISNKVNYNKISLAARSGREPTWDGTRKAILFATDKGLDADDFKLIANRDNWDIYLAYEPVGGDDNIIRGNDVTGATQSNPFSENLFNWLSRGTTQNVTISGGTGGTFTYSRPVALQILNIRSRGSNLSLYVDGVATDSPKTATAPSESIFYATLNQLGNASSQALTGYIYSMVAFSGSDTDADQINTLLIDRFITQNPYSIINNIPVAGDIDVYLLLGQSNASGRDDIDNLTDQTLNKEWTNAFIQGKGVGAGNEFINGTYTPGTQYLSDLGADQFGSELGIIKQADLDSKNVAFIKHSVGGTYLDDQGNTNDWSILGDTTSSNSYKKFYEMIAYLYSRGYNVNIKGVIWLQGEEDATVLAAANAYETNFDQFKIDMRYWLQESNLVFLSYDIGGAGTYKSTVDAALASSASGDSNHTHSTFTGTLSTIDGVHYDADSIVLLGENAYSFFNP